MADTKISDLSAVTDVIGTDEFVLARSGATKKIDASDLASGISGMRRISDLLLGTDTSNFDFTSIPSTYAHLRLVLYVRGTKSATSVQPRMTFNGDSGTNYDYEILYAASATGTAVGETGKTYVPLPDATAATAPTGSVGTIDILITNYAGTTFHKPLTAHGFQARAYSVGSEYLMMFGAIWKSTSAITQVTVVPDANQWAAGSRATLYGLV